MRSLLVTSLCGGILLLANPAMAAMWELDSSHSYVGFVARYMKMTDVRGAFQDVKGTLDWNEKDPTKSKVNVTMQTKSISTNHGQRDDHLRGPDFFDAEKFPVVTYTSTSFKKMNDKWEVLGELSMHGMTKTVTLMMDAPSPEMKDPFNNIKVAMTATGQLNRKDWGLTWNKTLDAGGLLIEDTIALVIEGQFRKMVPETKTTTSSTTTPTSKPSKQ